MNDEFVIAFLKRLAGSIFKTIQGINSYDLEGYTSLGLTVTIRQLVLGFLRWRVLLTGISRERSREYAHPPRDDMQLSNIAGMVCWC